jgi:rod shape-determining protein MreD
MITSLIGNIPWRAIASLATIYLLCLFASMIFFPLGLGWKIPLNFLWPFLFYFLVHRPSALPIFLCFALGLSYDVIAGAPIGLHAGLFILWRLVIVRQRRFLSRQAFIFYWLTFGAMMAATDILIWTIISVIYLHPLPVMPSILGSVVIIASYPILSRLFAPIDRWAFE